MANPKSNEVLTYSIENIQKEIEAINKKLDTKYVSHETFDLTISSLNKSVQTIVYTGLFLATPVYGAVIALVFKVFAEV